ncbi:hypothetical protein B0H13DRAFT_2231514 [Mycena leptocephala]|nr:hypothetical protein B0H13DRAFT_2231514 [Mycena leptocephala]
MDLENFDDVDRLDHPLSVEQHNSISSHQALDEVDQQWFTSATRRARWMDLLGDYAGAELFIISGESLLERVLDNPLLAIGRSQDGSFQLLHAYYILETTLLEFISRRANFEIVFWQVNYHSTVHTGDLAFNVASRHLARSLLFEHLLKLDVAVHTFDDLNDPSWLHFEGAKRPMFVLVNDGGLPSDCGRFHNERALLQRIFLFQLINGGMAIALLNDAEFHDSKILSFVYHEAHRRNQQPLSENIFQAAKRARLSMDAEIARHNPDQFSSLLSTQRRSTTQQSRMIVFSQHVVQYLRSDFSQELLFLFLLHAAILPELSLLERAQPYQSLSRDLMDLISNLFLPKVFFFASPLPFDIDGRVFISLISIVVLHPCPAFSDIVGPIAYEEACAVWSHLSLPIPDFSAFRARYKSTPANVVPADTSSVYKLLPFDHQVFNFNSVLLPNTSVEDETPAPATHLDFGVPFSDTTHWHNSRSILPSHLGGKTRQRENRSNQRFMATLQKNAATLTGALGTSLQQITIVSVKTPSKDSRIPKERTEPKNHQSGKKGKIVLTSTQQLREKIMREKAASQDDISYKWWRGSWIASERIHSMFRNKRSDEPMIGLEMRLYSLHITLHQWIESSERESAPVRDKFALAIMKEVKVICDRKALTASAADIIKTVLTSLGFAAYSSALLSGSLNLPDRPLAFAFEKLLKTTSKRPRYKFMSITEHPEVLDCIDGKFSVLVIAPTSAGKTFISYYSMEKVLRESDDGILVYVAPTKALVTQIAAEIYARFKKSLNGSSFTVPEILATLLLSPPLARVWTPRLKSIILDEIHSIGQQEGGAVWEQIILMAPCPIIGLSATVGSPQDFSRWLESVQQAHGFNYRVIEHPHRYSHLRKFYYIMDEKSLPPNSKRSRFLHPISLMSFGIRSIPDDLALEASDTLTLYQALAGHAPGCEALDPEVFFHSEHGPNLLVQKDIIRYERALKRQLILLMEARAGNDGDAASNIIRDLQDPKVRSLQDANKPPSRESYRKNLIFLLSDLHVKGELPAILFSFDRTDCDILVQELLSTLTAAEWKEKIRQWTSGQSVRKSASERSQSRKQRKQGDEDAPESRGEQHSWESNFNPDEPSPQFSFAGITAYQSATHFLCRLNSIDANIGTLALGINAPAKTAVFCGDSPFLTALMQYRQCSGRAGRRGFDLRGNVIFYGLPMERVQRLVLSKLPPLGGNFPLTSTLSLRLMNLLSGSNNAESAVAAVQSILELPRVSFVSNIGREQVLHHMRFSIEYLRRSGLLDKNGKPMNLFSLAAHLYYQEPSNFALVALLKSGALHDICEQDTITAKRNFILVMAHLFGRRYISRAYASEKNLALAKKSPSMVVLPDLPEPVREVLLYQDQKILDTFTGYALACAARLEMDPEVGQDSLLPLSKSSYPRILSQQPHSPNSCILRACLEDTAVRVVARSPFVANSGHGDKFGGVEELAHTTRNSLHLNNNAIPSLGHLTTSESGHVLNAYLLDFYIHGQVSTLAKANGIRRGDVWYLLQDFSLTLTTIQNSLKQLLMAVPGNTEATEPQVHDPAETEEEESRTTGRPAWVNERDWKLYTVASGALREFDEKFKAMWA